jgi:hypothetical protein
LVIELPARRQNLAILLGEGVEAGPRDQDRLSPRVDRIAAQGRAHVAREPEIAAQIDEHEGEGGGRSRARGAQPGEEALQPCAEQDHEGRQREDEVPHVDHGLAQMSAEDRERRRQQHHGQERRPGAPSDGQAEGTQQAQGFGGGERAAEEDRRLPGHVVELRIVLREVGKGEGRPHP